MPSLYTVINRLADLLDVTLSGTGWLHWTGSAATLTTPTAAEVGAAPATHTHAGTVTGASRYHTNSSQALSTSNGNGNGTLRVSRFDFDRAVTLDRIACEVTAAGEAGSLMRLGIYADSNGVPGSLVLDAGTVAGDGTAGIREATANLSLAAGSYWIGGAVQAAPTTQPTLRICAGVLPTTQNGTLTTLSQTWGGYSQTGVSGALPATFSATPALAVTVPRVAVRVV